VFLFLAPISKRWDGSLFLFFFSLPFTGGSSFYLNLHDDVRECSISFSFPSLLGKMMQLTSCDLGRFSFHPLFLFGGGALRGAVAFFLPFPRLITRRRVFLFSFSLFFPSSRRRLDGRAPGKNLDLLSFFLAAGPERRLLFPFFFFFFLSDGPSSAAGRPCSLIKAPKSSSSPPFSATHQNGRRTFPFLFSSR